MRPAWLDFFLFVAAYLSGDKSGAASYAAQILPNEFPLAYAARALAAAQYGDDDVARKQFGRLTELQPAWREHTRREIKKVFPADAVAVRLIRDLSPLNAGLGQ